MPKFEIVRNHLSVGKLHYLDLSESDNSENDTTEDIVEKLRITMNS